MHYVRLLLGSLLFTLLFALAGYLFSMPVFPAEATAHWVTPTITPACATPTITPTYTATPTPFGQALITMTPSMTPGPTVTPCVPTMTPPPTTGCATPTMTPSPLTDKVVLLTPTPSATPCGGTVTPTYTPTPTPYAGVFSATLHLEPSVTTLTVGEPLVVAFNLDVEGCVYASYDLTLEQVGGTLLQHINPADPVIGPPVSYPAVFELQAIQSGTVQLRGKLYGEVNCQGWQWQYIYSELITITVLPEGEPTPEPTPLPTHLINVTVNITSTTVEVGDEFTVDVAYSNESGCEVVMWAANLLQSDPALFEYVEPTTNFIAPVESWPASFRIRAVASGTVQLSGRADGEIHCADGGYFSIFVASEAPLIITIEEDSGGGGVTPTTYQQFLPVLQRVH